MKREKEEDKRKRRDKARKSFFLYPLLFTFSLLAFHSNTGTTRDKIHSLTGHATIIWQTKKQTYRFDQIVVIKNPQEAVFETLDDFGSTVMTIRLTPTETILSTPAGEIRKKSTRGKKIGLLPIGRDDLIAALLDQSPSRNKKIKISFLEFRNFGRIRYPKIIRFETKKSSLTLEWQHVTFQ